MVSVDVVDELAKTECLSWFEVIYSLGSPLDYLDLPLFDLLDEFQWRLFKILLFIVLTNVTLIYLFWHIYGAKIVEKFMTPTSSALLLEELKLSISELKLPKEHSPRL